MTQFDEEVRRREEDTMNQERVDLIMKYALAVASEEDDFRDRELGPIHLIKYVYLADLAHARRHRGETYTGTPWRFHHFGPWCNQVNERIDPLMKAIGAYERVIESIRYEKDGVRWSLSGDVDVVALGCELPPEVAHGVKRDVHEFGQNTTELLHYVYRTRPMLNAAPEELLQFSCVADDGRDRSHRSRPQAEAPLSTKAMKRKKQKIQAARERVKKKLEERRASASRKKVSLRPPRYDEVYERGVAWLDSLAGQPLSPLDGELVVSSEVWKSEARRGSGDSGARRSGGIGAFLANNLFKSLLSDHGWGWT